MCGGRSDVREEVKNSLGQAAEDLETARLNVEIKRYYASVFFSQQAAEKALKALYMAAVRKTPITHDMVTLAQEVSAPEAVLEGAMELNADYVITRHPDAAGGVPARQYTLKMAEPLSVCEGYPGMGLSVLEKVDDFLRRLRRFHLQEAIVFGSHATGEGLEDSDIDLILVSDDFEGVFFPNRITLVRRYWPFRDGLDVLCYTRGEFEKRRNMLGIVQRAVSEGISVRVPPDEP